MKKKNIIIGVVILLVIASLFMVYQRMINVFDEKTIVSMTVTSPDGLTTKFYTLDNKQLTMLSNNLESAMKSDLSTEGATAFTLTLLNKWDISQHHTIYMHENGDILIKEDKTEDVKFLTTSLFFKSHEAFDAYYDKYDFPSFALHLNGDAQAFNITTSNWSFMRLNNRWADKVLSPKIKENDPMASKAYADELLLTADKLADKATYVIKDTESGETVATGDFENTLPIPELNGNYAYALTMNWDGKNNLFKGDATLEFNLLVNHPPKVTLETPEVIQGQLAVLKAINVTDVEKIEIEQSLSEKAKWFKADQAYTYVMPTNYTSVEGQRAIKVTDLESKNEETLTLTLVKRAFKVQELTIDPNVENEKRTDDAIAEFKEKVTAKQLESSPEKYYEDGKFVVPTKGRLTTEYGEMRSVNGALTSYRHSGIDIGAKTDTPVMATNKGKVVLADELTLTGFTVLIDHGQGIFSIYEHLNSLSVKEGDLVDQTTEIGKVGSTGFSTGPHLHFTMSFFDLDIEPGFLILGEPFTKEKHAVIE